MLKQQKRILDSTLFLLGCSLGALVFLLLFSFAPLVCTNDSWLRTGFVEKDIIQHYTGWLFFRESAWSFPLGMSDSMNYPYGNAVTFTDSIPLFAIFFKLVEGTLPETFQYFGLFAFLSYMLQGGASMLLLSLFTRKLPALLFGSTLFLTTPVLIERTFRHTALTAQWLVLFALYLYFKNKREEFHFRMGYLVLLGLAITIHPYFIPMLFGILFADLVEHCLATKELGRSALFLGVGMLLVIGIGGCIGIFSVPSSSERIVGYGYFGMNLNTLWTPVSAGDLLWSSTLPRQNQGLGTYEGFNYLGLAVLIVAPICAVRFLLKEKWSGVLAVLKTHCGLVFVCACLTIFALSNTWVANIRVLFTIPMHPTLKSMCDTFRASGRMFWPVYYLIFLFVAVTVAELGGKHVVIVRRFGAPVKTTMPWHYTPAQRRAAIGSVLLAVVLCVQVVDMRGVLALKKHFFTDHESAFVTEMTDPIWEDIAEHYDHLFSLDDYLYATTDVALYAATNGMTTNDGFTSRFDFVRHRIDVIEETERLMQGEFAESTCYLTSNEDTFADIAAATQGLAYAVRIDWNWYAILPIVDGLPEPSIRTSLYVYPLMPFTIPDYYDDDFSGGISHADPSTITFYRNKFTELYLGMATQVFDTRGNRYDILAYDYNYENRFIITLDVDDASFLKGQYLATDQNIKRPPM